MSESNELYASVNYIKNKVDTLEKIEILRMKTDIELKNKYASMLQSDKDLLTVYKAIDGIKSQKEIANTCNKNEVQVSRKIAKLEMEGLIERVGAVISRNKIYIHTVVERAYRFSKEL